MRNSLLVMKDDRHVSFCTAAMFHRLAFRKPDKGSRTERASVSDQVPFEDEHGVAARVCVCGSD
jgi:hypothetical protein